MSAFDETQHPRVSTGQFTEKTNTSPEASLAGAPQQPGESLVWAVEGDDHEVELVEASTEADALERAAERFSSRYDTDYDADLLIVTGAFRGDIDETDELEFVPVDGVDEATARRALRNL